MTGSAERPAKKAPATLASTSIFRAGEDAAGERLDAWLTAQLPAHLSRSRVKALISGGHVALEGGSAEPNYRLKGGETVRLVIPEPEEAAPAPEAIPLHILYEDPDLIVVDKPPGMVVHPAAGNWTGTLVNALLYHCGDSLSGIGGVRRPGIVHRLDKETSGVMVVAKTEAAMASLAAQFADHGRGGPLERAYLALVWGAPDPPAATIEAPLGRSPSNRLKRAVVKPGTADARAAITHYRVEHVYEIGDDRTPVAARLYCRLETGRTHQIRVHMAHIGHPLIGDPDYGAHFASKANTLPAPLRAAVTGFNRQALHAAQLGFKHPKTGETMRFETPPPADFTRLIAIFGRLER